MLEVHAPHGSVGTWRDFLVHVAIITIGLLIALGLEQTAEALHHHHQINETRQALRHELELNRRAYAESVGEFRRQTAALLNNVLVLRYIRQHPGTPEEQLPGILVWHAFPGSFTDSAWKTAQQSGVTAFMPQEEVRRNDALYDRIDEVGGSFDQIWAGIVRARLYSVFDPDPTHLSPAEIVAEIALTNEILVKNFAAAGALVELNRAEPGFTPALTKPELNHMMHVLDTEEDPRLAQAIAITNQRLPPDAQVRIPRATPASPAPVSGKAP